MIFPEQTFLSLASCYILRFFFTGLLIWRVIFEFVNPLIYNQVLISTFSLLVVSGEVVS